MRNSIVAVCTNLNCSYRVRREKRGGERGGERGNVFSFHKRLKDTVLMQREAKISGSV